MLGLFPRHGYAVLDGPRRTDAERRVWSGLQPGAWPDPWTATLVLLSAVSGIARAVVPPPTDKAGRRAVADHLNGLRLVVGGPVADLVDVTRHAYHRAGNSGDGFVASGGAGCYGDGGGDGGGGGVDGGGGDGGGGGGD